MSDRDDDRAGPRLTRRRLLFTAGSATAAAGLVSLPGCGSDDEAAQAVAAPDVDAPQLRNAPYVPPAQQPFQCLLFSFFTPAEARAVEAFTARLVPGSADDPGAREACVTNYIDRKLGEFEGFATTTYTTGPFAEPANGRAPGFHDGVPYVAQDQLPRYGFQSDLTPQQAYRRGLATLDRYARSRHGVPFEEIPEGTQDTILELLEADALGSFRKPGGKALFTMIQQDTNEGMFADPIYGGNRDFAGWKLIGYPGAQRAWTPKELKDGPHERTVQGLLQMAPMHPGRPDPNAILPIEGSREAQRP